ncbi:hypothetical protein F5Y07DRAFT_413172 [Xylaria sp. FL0933]|nr:hypothetical protein F5Y07DRAFT_413172 [Xylaria sp. FL0933]
MPELNRISISLLDSYHYKAFAIAIHRVLATDLALETYSQIIDGLPLSKVAWDRYSGRLDRRHPISLHTKLCTEAFEVAKSMRDQLDMRVFSFEPKVSIQNQLTPSDLKVNRPIQLLQLFQSATPRSRRFQLRLLELVAVTLHQIAIYLFQNGPRLHDRHCSYSQDPENNSHIDAITSWKPPPSRWPGKEPWPTLFAHPAFTAHEQYPAGVADMVGYWAEDRILGGVALFDRSKTWDDEIEEPNVYFQSSRPKRTYQIYQLTDKQQQELLRFLSLRLDHDSSSRRGDEEDNFCPLPISFSHGENDNLVDPEFAVVRSKIYRDPWERPPPRPYQQFIRERDVVIGQAEEELKRLRRLGL